MIKYKILWVEDDKDFFNLIEQAFTEDLVHLDLVQSLRQAEERLSSINDYSHIIVDLNLGDKTDGLQLIKAIKRSHPWIPIIIVSNGETHEIRQAYQQGADDFFAKSYMDITELLDSISRLSNLYQIRVSYAHQDTLFAIPIIEYLKYSGLKVFDLRQDTSLGTSIIEELNVIPNISFYVPIFSENTNSSTWQQKEIELLNSRKMKVNILPLVIGNIKNILLPESLKEIKHANLKKDFQNFYNCISELIVEAIPSKSQKYFKIQLSDDQKRELWEIIRQKFIEENYDNGEIVAQSQIDKLSISDKEFFTEDRANDINLPINERLKIWEYFAKFAFGNEDAKTAFKSFQEIEYLKNQKSIQESLATQAHISKIKMNNFWFFGKWSLELNPKMNIILSKNGVGKTVLLRLIAALLYYDHELVSDVFHTKNENSSVEIEVIKGSDKLSNKITVEGISGELRRTPFLPIGDLRYIVGKERLELPVGATDLNLYETQRYRDTEFLFIKQLPEQNNFISLLSLLVKAYDKSNTEDFNSIPLFQVVIEVLNDLFDNSFTFVRIERKDRPNEPDQVEILVKTPNSKDPIQLQFLSRGSNSILYLFLSIYLHLEATQKERERYPEYSKNLTLPNVLKESGIVLIDEIDAHLHLNWQKKVIKLLTRIFPNVQFIVASHSPFIVNHLEEGKIVQLSRSDINGVICTGKPLNLGYSIPDISLDYFDTLSIPDHLDELTFLLDEDELQEMLSTSQKELRELTSKKTEKKLKKIEAEIKKLKSKIDYLKNHISNLRIEQIESKIGDLQLRIDLFKAELFQDKL